MVNRNFAVEQQFRPEELMRELDIKRQAYYDYLKHLGIKAEKDSNNRAYLTQAQAKSVRLLRRHVVAGGRIEDFDIHEALESSLVVAESAERDDMAEPLEELNLMAGLDMEALYLEASEIAGQRLTAEQQLVMAIASQMGYEDLHPVTKAKVDQVRRAKAPTFDAQKVAADLLSQFRRKMQTA